MITPTKNLILSLIAVAIIGLLATPSLKQTQNGAAQAKARTVAAKPVAQPSMALLMIAPANAQKSDIHQSPKTGDGSN